MYLRLLLISILLMVARADLGCLLAESVPSSDCLNQVTLEDAKHSPELILSIAEVLFNTQFYNKAQLFFREAFKLIEHPHPKEFRLIDIALRQDRYYDALQLEYQLLEKFGLAYPKLIEDVLSEFEGLNDFFQRKASKADFKDLAVAHYLAQRPSECLKLIEKDTRGSATITPLHYLKIRAL